MEDRVMELDMYQQALNLEHPWYVIDRRFNHTVGRLDIFLGFHRGGTFTCSACNTPNQPFHDTDKDDQMWRHLDFFQYKAFIHAPHPRVKCSSCQKVKYALVPWSRYNCSFTHHFEKFVLTLVTDMPVNAVARIVREHDTRLWRIVHFYVDQALEKQDLSTLTRVAVDETSARRGHKYVTLFLDSDTRKVVFVTQGKDSSTVGTFKQHLETHHGDAENIAEYCSDMSAAFMSGMGAEFPKAEHTIDKFHVMKLLNDAVDDVRRQEQSEAPELKKTRYLWLKNQRDLRADQVAHLSGLSESNLRTGRAYRLKLAFQELWSQPKLLADLYLNRWYQWAVRSQVPQMIDVAKTIRQHEHGILHWFLTKMTNGLIEALNGIVQAAKRKARGYRTTRNLITMIYLVGGKLGLTAFGI